MSDSLKLIAEQMIKEGKSPIRKIKQSIYVNELVWRAFFTKCKKYNKSANEVLEAVMRAYIAEIDTIEAELEK